VRTLALFALLSVACDGAPPQRPAEAPGEGREPTPVEAPGATAVVAPDPGAPPPAAFLDGYDLDERVARFDLPGRLDEISGLAFSPDGRLFAHDDERGRVHEIDPLTGEVGKRFDLGAGPVADDFEGIAIVGERFFLVSSTGRLYEFREGDDRAIVAYRVTDTGLGRGCEIEGLDWDPAADELLIPFGKMHHADE